jgi:hemoglobin
VTERGRLIEALGGEAGCRSLSAAFYARVAGDPELKPLFPGKSMRCATEEFSAFLVQFLGGDEEATQYRWWLSLRESHARFRISESQRTAWLSQMRATLESSHLEADTRQAMLQFFVSASFYTVGGESAPVSEPELAERWKHALALDALAADISAGRDAAVLQNYKRFASRPSLFVGVLSRMMQTRRADLVRAVAESIEHDPALRKYRSAGRTLLHNAAAAGFPDIVKLLLRIGVDPNVLDTGDHPPLYRLANECVTDAGPEIAQILVAAGAEVNHRGGSTRATPLHMAARRGHVEIARALVDLGASLDLRDTKGCTPLERAINCRKSKVAELLRQLDEKQNSNFS